MYGKDSSMYNNVEYARMRLVGTVIRYKKKLVYIMDVWESGDGDGIYCAHRGIGGGNQEEGKLIDYNLTALPLGNVNYGGVSSYMSRIPMRHDWRQGTRAANTLVSNQGSHKNPSVPIKTLLKSRALSKCVNNIYPTVHECLDSLDNEEVQGIAFSKVFSLTISRDALPGYAVYYKGNTQVGFIKKGQNKIKLFDEYDHLKESVEETVNA